MRLVYHGPFWPGSTSLHRLEAFSKVEGVEVIPHDTLTRPGDAASFYERVRWRLGWPVDRAREAERLIQYVAEVRPDVVLVDNTKVFRPTVLQLIRSLGVKVLAYYTPDDVMNPLNLKRPLRESLGYWDVFFTTKTFNVAELRALGVREPRLVGNAFDPISHHPLTATMVGAEYEQFDFVFAGACEHARLQSVNTLAQAGHSIVVYGGDMGGWKRKKLHANIVLRPAAFGDAYLLALHHGKIALGFLRKMNRDRITTRSIEITAAGRPMLAEKTDEHDAHFIDGEEYAGFRSDTELVAIAKRYLENDVARRELGYRARRRCLNSGYSTLDRAREMTAILKEFLE